MSWSEWREGGSERLRGVSSLQWQGWCLEPQTELRNHHAWSRLHHYMSLSKILTTPDAYTQHKTLLVALSSSFSCKRLLLPFSRARAKPQSCVKRNVMVRL